MVSKLKQIQYKNIVWIHASDPTDEDLSYLKEKFGFHPLDIADVKSISQRPKLDEYPQYIFMVLLFAWYDRAEREIKAAEIDFFIGEQYLITISDGHLMEIDRFFQECNHHEATRQLYMGDHPVQLLHEIIHRQQVNTFAMLDHISLDIENIERQIFAGNERHMVKEILFIKRNIVGFRRVMQSHKNIIKRLMATRTKFFMPDTMNIYFNNILERSKDIWEILEGHKENIDAFASTNESLISFKLNDIMKILTIISVILIPANLVASLFGMNTQYTPLLHHPLGFYVVLLIMATIMGSLLLWFNRKGWLK